MVVALPSTSRTVRDWTAARAGETRGSSRGGRPARRRESRLAEWEVSIQALASFLDVAARDRHIRDAPARSHRPRRRLRRNGQRPGRMEDVAGYRCCSASWPGAAIRRLTWRSRQPQHSASCARPKPGAQRSGDPPRGHVPRSARTVGRRCRPARAPRFVLAVGAGSRRRVRRPSIPRSRHRRRCRCLVVAGCRIAARASTLTSLSSSLCVRAVIQMIDSSTIARKADEEDPADDVGL